jgi:hypothetical protein
MKVKVGHAAGREPSRIHVPTERLNAQRMLRFARPISATACHPPSRLFPL